MSRQKGNYVWAGQRKNDATVCADAKRPSLKKRDFKNLAVRQFVKTAIYEQALLSCFSGNRVK